MESVVEILKLEFIGKSVMKKEFFDFGWKICMCATGPSMLTAAVAEVIIDGTPGAEYRIAGRDFSSLKGRFKVSSDRQSESHYMKIMGSMNSATPSLLKDYALEFDNGTLIQCLGDKAIYFIENNEKRIIPDFPTFIAMNLSISKVQKIGTEQFKRINLGMPLPSLLR
jgi:hypothetical protein